VDQLANLFDTEVDVGEGYEATTVGGLVSEVAGRIPMAGEVVMLEDSGLRMEVVASTDRRVDRVRVFPPAIMARTNLREPSRTDSWEE
jgi:CBS domain containing-hemolysin-like protein